MLYNIYINGGIAIKVTDHNVKCTPCNNMDSVPSEEVRVMRIILPQGWNNGNRLEQIKRYINLNNIL